MREEKSSYFSEICVQKCSGMCCDPWWGIISYGVVKEGGLSGLSGFRTEILKGINARAQRIMKAYVTDEEPPRELFGAPERYNVKITGLKVNGTSLSMELLAMYAFRCRFLSRDKSCAAHPGVLGGRDIRPPHCGYMGAPDVKPGEKGFCRIIHAALGQDADDGVKKAIEVEKGASSRHHKEGADTAEEAADNVMKQLKEMSLRYAADLLPKKTEAVPGRNEPCYCGSGEKYKRCHGR